MKRVLKGISIVLLSLLLIHTKSFAMNELLYNPKYEFRGAWVATVYNLDWPSSKGLKAWEQKKEYKEMIKEMKRVGMNAIVMQIRPMGDAMYPSQYAPWSSYLTGIQGKDPGYDVLKFMIDEAHREGLEFHAWLNPFRIMTKTMEKEELAECNIAKIHPEWTVEYERQLMMNPGIPEVRKYIINIVEEIVTKYPVDAIHFDDYFYPYLTKGSPEYPDEETFRCYNQANQDIETWRRENINELIRGIDILLKEKADGVKFGISPFGIWANQYEHKEGSATMGGVSSYSTLYADTKHWVEEGWIDYIVPQLYWTFEFEKASYDVLVNWWNNEVKNKTTQLYVGQAPYKIEQDDEWSKEEILNQLNFNRLKENVGGSVFFRAGSLREDLGGVGSALKREMYNTKAIVPPMEWLGGEVPGRLDEVHIKKKGNRVKLTWVDTKPWETDYYVIYRFSKEEDNINDPDNIREVIYNMNKEGQKKQFIDRLENEKEVAYRISAVNKAKGEGEPSERIVMINK